MKKFIEKFDKIEKRINDNNYTKEILNPLETAIVLENIKNNNFLPGEIYIEKSRNKKIEDLTLENCNIYLLNKDSIFNVNKRLETFSHSFFLLPNVTTTLSIGFIASEKPINENIQFSYNKGKLTFLLYKDISNNFDAVKKILTKTLQEFISSHFSLFFPLEEYSELLKHSFNNSFSPNQNDSWISFYPQKLKLN